MTQRPNGFDSELAIQAASATTWRLLAPLVWTGTKGDAFTVPLGFVTDFATVPRFLVWKMLPYGPYTRAAVLHDWLIEHRINAASDRVTSRDVDGIFRRVMEDLGTPWMTRWQMWAAVRLAACFNSRRAYGRAFGRDAAKVFGILIITAPVILPGAVGVLISLALARPFAGRPASARADE
jgi:hypothetical protein